MAVWCEERPYENSADPDVHPVFRGRSSVHLMADSQEELIRTACRLGCKISWLQHKGRYTEHFDLTGTILLRAMNDPTVVKLSRRDFVDAMVAKRQQAINSKALGVQSIDS